jgi:nicotinamidase-related amidase
MEILKAGEKNISEIIFMGFCTDICVISNVLMAKAFLPNTPITVEASCCAGSTIEKHYAALAVMESCHIDVVE